MALIDLPIELIEEFVHNLEKPADILSLGLTCKLLHSLTIPCPLLYREVLWPNHDGRMASHIWRIPEPSREVVHTNPTGELSAICADHLIEEPRRAKGVRDLVVSGQGAPSPPRFLLGHLRSSNKTPLEFIPSRGVAGQEWRERYIAILASTQADLARALWHMPYLQSFTWDWRDPDASGPLWDPLLRIKSMKRVHFTLDDFAMARGEDRFGTAPDATLQCIASTAEHWPLLSSLFIEVNFYYYDSDPGDDEEGMSSCTWSAAPVLRCHYYQLRELELTHARGFAEDVANFFGSHLLIEKLVLIDHLFDFSAVDHNILPRLSFLEMSTRDGFLAAEASGGIGELFFTPLRSGSRRPISELGLHLNSIHIRRDKVDFWLPSLSITLKRLRVESSFDTLSNLTGAVEDPVQWLLNILPNLTYLTVPEEAGDFGDSVQEDKPLFTESQVPQIERWAGYFASSSCLEVLSLTAGGDYMYLDMEAIEEIKRRPTVQLEDIFRSIAPDIRVTSVTCVPHDKIEIACTRLTT